MGLVFLVLQQMALQFSFIAERRAAFVADARSDSKVNFVDVFV